ncbi:unknown [Azospirillum sp. CAG:260]|jgi:hypothetical protein|uniref:Uncharacterized protein n=2 Tax=root TaxID=1 RepID=A0A9D1SB78_9PROT|nr:unknown [Azospirillum sp. CAG:260]DAE17654.1 MAG TPA: hypothetical protein [Podoviridae sp. ctx0K11]DAG58242.1 MAG TPA: hypothetical protein [Caudoviricetes sp.]DAI27865.1 MAG TPA: hypothetical protein [Caudoviricetes sp.]HIU53272.1 hypothetical protein [Candidatus Scatocola faecipullorum]
MQTLTSPQSYTYSYSCADQYIDRKSSEIADTISKKVIEAIKESKSDEETTSSKEFK